MRRCPAHERRPTPSAGFTLVEIAVVIVVLGFLLAMIAGIATSLIGQQRREINRQRMAGVETALALFVSQNQRLPCPADGRLASNAVAAGTEARVGGACQTVGGTANSQTHGVVPWQSLGLSEQDITDGWGSRITYRVAPELVADHSMDLTSCDPGGNPATALSAGGAEGPVGTCKKTCSASNFPDGCNPPAVYTAGKGLFVRNLASATPIMSPSVSPSTGAAYVAISHGENREGAYNNEGILQGGTPASGTLEAANNAANVAFVYATSAATVAFVDDFPVYAAGTGHFDDVLLRPTILAIATKAQLGPRAH